MKISAIEIGTNSTKMIVVEELYGESYKLLEKKSEVNRLSNNMYGNSIINLEAMDKADTILGEFLNKIKEYDTKFLGIFSTSVLRDASNRVEFIDKVKKKYGYEIKVISGEEEASLAYKACLSHINDAEEVFSVIDIGGGSTEIIIGTRDDIEQTVSIDIGAVRLTESFVNSDPISIENITLIKEFIINKFKQLDYLIPTQTGLIGTGGTIKAIGTMILNIDYAKESEVNGLTIKKDQIIKIFKNISNKNIEQRKNIIGLNPKRADVIIAGLITLLTIMDLYKIEELIISTAGVLEGFIQDYINNTH